MERGEQLGRLLWRYGHGNPARTFVLVPYAGGSVFAFAGWIPLLLAPDEAALVVRYPEPAGEHGLAALAVAAADAVAGAVDGPLVLVGHSMGGLVAYEMALCLEHSGRPVRLLAVSAARPPGHPVRSAAEVLGMTGGQWRDEVLAQGLVDEEGVESGMLDILIPVLRRNYLMVARYRPGAGRVACPLLAVGGAADPEVSSDLLSRWAERTAGEFNWKTFPGGHFYYEDRLRQVCRTILDAATASGYRKARRSS